MEETRVTVERPTPRPAAADAADAQAGQIRGAARVFAGVLTAAAVCALLALDSAWYGGYAYAAVGAVAVGVALAEFARLAGGAGAQVAGRLLVPGGVLLFLAHWGAMAFPGSLPGPWLLAAVVLVGVVMVVLADRVLRARIDGALQDVGAVAVGLAYVPLSMAFLTAVRLQAGPAGLVTVLIVTKMGSTGAYFAGKGFGRRKLAPTVSPNKTVEGAVGAFAACIVTAFALSRSPWATMGGRTALAYGAVVAATGIMGDLAASLLKRQAGLKDSGRALPGMGGALDEMDDLLFTAPVSFVFLYACGVLG